MSDTDDTQPWYMYDPEPWFWELLESSDHNLQLLINKLEALPKEQLIEFQLQYEEAKGCVYPLYDPYFGYQADDCSLSEDYSDDFSSWVVSQGRAFYEQVRNNPEDIQRYLDMFGESDGDANSSEMEWNTDVEREEYRGWQGPEYIANAIFERRFNENLKEELERRWEEERSAQAATEGTPSLRAFGQVSSGHIL